MRIFPVRHHSPAAALQLQRLVRAEPPRAILIEGPADATSLIPHLLDPETRPPVAIYAYLTGESVHAAFYPYCAYSPEYVALQLAQEVGIHAELCDLPAGVSLTAEMPEEELTGDESALDYERFMRASAEAAGFDSTEGFWEAAFEQDDGSRASADYVELLKTLGDHVVQLGSPIGASFNDLRERYMASVGRRLVQEGLRPGEILLICGAAHASAIARHFQEETEPPKLPNAPAAELALVPYSYPRLSEQAGYGAGNRAPWYYQQVWELQGDYASATRRALIALAHHLRSGGYLASSAQCIDAYNLTRTLASLRGKVAPGVDELSDAAAACLGQGQPALVESALRQVMIGNAMGTVTGRVGRTPLQAEFHATAQRLGLPIIDAPRQVLVHLPIPREAAQSVFLHRLRTAGIPYARELETGLAGRGQAAQRSTLGQLGRTLEKWELQWSPLTDAQLVERTAWGATLSDVCTRLLHERLDAAPRVDLGTAVLFEMALCDLLDLLPAATERCDALGADSASFVALAQAAYHLDGLLNLGAARRLDVDRLTALAARLSARAIVALPAATNCGDDAAAEVQPALLALHELAQRGSTVVPDPGAFWAAVDHLVESPHTHPSLRGVCLVLLELDGRLAEGTLAERLGYWLSMRDDAAANARLVAGLFSLHRGTLVRHRALIRAVTDFLLELEIDQLTPLLPVLRRTLGNLNTPERTYLTETLGAILGIEHGNARRALALSSVDQQILGEVDAAVAATLAQWSERYGIK